MPADRLRLGVVGRRAARARRPSSAGAARRAPREARARARPAIRPAARPRRRASPASRKWFVCASRPSRGSIRATPAGESSKHAPPPRGVDDRDAARGRVGRLAQQRPGVLDARGARSSSRRSTRCTGMPSSPPPSRRVVEDVERRRRCPRVETPTLARIPASVIVAKRAPSTAADQTTQRSGASAYQSQFCASHGPSALSQRPTRRALGEREQLGAAVERGDQLGLEPRARGERLQLGGERRMPARACAQHARRRSAARRRARARRPRTAAGRRRRQIAVRAPGRPGMRARARGGSVASRAQRRERRLGKVRTCSAQGREPSPSPSTDRDRRR